MDEKEIKAAAWDEGYWTNHKLMLEWYKPETVEIMYWPEAQNPYREG